MFQMDTYLFTDAYMEGIILPDVLNQRANQASVYMSSTGCNKLETP